MVRYELQVKEVRPFPWLTHIIVCICTGGLWIPVMLLHYAFRDE